MIFPPPAHSGGGLQITNSVRLRAAASAYFSRTFGTATDGTIYTWSSWIKRGLLGTSRPIVQGYLNGNNYGNIIFTASDSIQWMEFAAAANNGQVHTNAVFRDPSAHLHLVVTRNGTTVTIYVNGVSQSLTTDVAIAAPAGYLFGNATANRIGSDQVTGNYHDGYLSDVYFIDGQALTPSSFGETNSDGVWVPKAYTGTYGTNGFHLDFKDAALTAGSNVGLGKDVSGNGNYWTTNNISVTAGVTYDSMVDTPTNNYATLNPINTPTSPTIVSVLSEASLKATFAPSFDTSSFSTMPIPASSKMWAEVTITNSGTVGFSGCGIVYNAPNDARSQGVLYHPDGNKRINNTSTAYGSTYTTGDVIGIEVNTSTNSVTFYKQTAGTGSFVAQPSISYTPTSDVYFTSYDVNASNGVFTWNFGQRPFNNTSLPTGAKALCTANLQPSVAPTASGSFTGNAAADGPFVWIGGVPSTLTINSNAVTFGTHADKTAGGFKLRTASASYNTAGANTWTATFASPSTKSAFAVPQTAQGNP